MIKNEPVYPYLCKDRFNKERFLTSLVSLSFLSFHVAQSFIFAHCENVNRKHLSVLRPISQERIQREISIGIRNSNVGNTWKIQCAIKKQILIFKERPHVRKKYCQNSTLPATVIDAKVFLSIHLLLCVYKIGHLNVLNVIKKAGIKPMELKVVI